MFLDIIKQANSNEPCCSKDLQKTLSYGLKIDDLSKNLVKFFFRHFFVILFINNF